jgi:hypothetical protein
LVVLTFATATSVRAQSTEQSRSIPDHAKTESAVERYVRKTIIAGDSAWRLVSWLSSLRRLQLPVAASGHDTKPFPWTGRGVLDTTMTALIHLEGLADDVDAIAPEQAFVGVHPQLTRIVREMKLAENAVYMALPEKCKQQVPLAQCVAFDRPEWKDLTEATQRWDDAALAYPPWRRRFAAIAEEAGITLPALVPQPYAISP